MAFKNNSGNNDLFQGLVAEAPVNQTLELIDAVVDWSRIRTLLSRAYSREGRPGFDPVVPAKMLLLEAVYNLSDVAVSRECADRLSFRKFLRLELSDIVPDDTTLVRFRTRLRDHNLLEEMEKEFLRMLAEKSLSIRPGSITIIDATLITAATQPPSKETDEQKPSENKADRDADFTVKRGKPHFGYKLHLAEDAATGLIPAHRLTPASVHDSKVFEELLSGDEAIAAADRGYDSGPRRKGLRKRGTLPLIMKRTGKNAPETLRKVTREFNRCIGKIRCRIESTIGNLKRWRRCGRAVYTGLVKVGEQMTWGIIAHNFLVIKRWTEKCA